MDEKLLLEEFKATDTADLLAKKQQDRQERVFAIKKPTPIALTQDQCMRLCEGIGVNYSTGYESRVLQYIISNENSDRYGDIVRAQGGNFKNYMANPVMFFSHNYSTPPIGNTLKVWVDGQAKNVQGWGLFLDDTVDKTGMSDLIFRMASSGFMKACSIGFRPLKTNYPSTDDERMSMGLGKYGVEYLEWEMLEWSPCGIPANPTALQNSLKDIGNRLSLDQRHIDAAATFKLFSDVNLLDQFAETVGKKIGKTFSLPKIGDATIVKVGDTDVVPPVAATITTEGSNEGSGEVQKTEAGEVKKISSDSPGEDGEDEDEKPHPITINLNLDALTNAITSIVELVKSVTAGVDEIKQVQATILEAVELIKQHNAETSDRKSLYGIDKPSFFSKPNL